MHPNDVLLDGTRQRVLVYHVVMARRKPATQPTGIIDVVKDIVSPWLGAPPAQNKQVTQAQGLARAAAETLDQTVTGGMIKAGVQGNQALVKQAAVNAAALGAGYIAGKAAVTAASAAAKTGVVPRAVRAITGRQKSYFVHGSPTSGIKKLDPMYETMPDKIVSDPQFEDRWPDGVNPNYANTYGWSVTKRANQKGSSNILQPRADVQESIKDSYGYAGDYGSLYIAKAPRKYVNVDDEDISVPAKVVKEIRTTNKTEDQVVQETEKALRKLGFIYPKQPKKR